MSYAQKFQSFRESLIKYCKECISENWNKMFDMWLMSEADMKFGYGYQNKCKECSKNIHELFYDNERHLCFFCRQFIDILRDKETTMPIITPITKFISTHRMGTLETDVRTIESLIGEPQEVDRRDRHV